MENKNSKSKNIESKNSESKDIKSKNSESKINESKNIESKISESKNIKSKNSESKINESKKIGSKISESKNSESKNNESKNSELKSEIEIIYEKSTKDINYYNNFMHNLFSELSKKISSILKGTKTTWDILMKNMKKNVSNLVTFIQQLDENKNKEIYNCLSCIFGAFLGDAIGAYCEFRKPNLNNIKKIFIGKPMFGDDPGQVTDDSEMAMASSFALMDNPEINDINSDICYYYYGLWHISRPRDEGNTTRTALKLFKANIFNPEKQNNYKDEFDKIKSSNDGSLANGFLMRASPFIVWCYFRFNEQITKIFKSSNPNQNDLFGLFLNIKNQARKDNICTHPNDTLSDAQSLFCIMAFGAICGLKPHQILIIIEILLKINYFNQEEIKNIKKMIMDELDHYKKDTKKELSNINNIFPYFTKGEKSVVTHMGFYYHSFRLTLYYLYYLDEIKSEKNFTKYRTIMNQICAFGGDTDTNAAIVGTVIGPLIGYKKFGDEEFKKMISLIPKKRFIFSPALMLIYVYFIKDNNNKGKFEMNFLKMFLTLAFQQIDSNNLNDIFTNPIFINNSKKEE